MGLSFAGKSVLVTGGAGGLGSAIVKKFVESGATVYALDYSVDSLEKLKSEIPSVQTVVADLTKWDEVRAIVEGLGPLDHLVNNAGIIIGELILDVSESTLDRTLNVNFKAAYNLSQVFCKNVLANSIRDATIVNVSSFASVRTSPYSSTYSCSKAALEMMTKSFAVEMGPHEIRINAILPTSMDTNIFLDIPKKLVAESMERIKSKSPISNFLETADAANVVLYLSSSMSKMITGTCIPIDGGALCIM